MGDTLCTICQKLPAVASFRDPSAPSGRCHVCPDCGAEVMAPYLRAAAPNGETVSLPAAVLHQKLHERVRWLRAECERIAGYRAEMVKLEAVLKAWDAPASVVTP